MSSFFAIKLNFISQLHMWNHNHYSIDKIQNLCRIFGTYFRLREYVWNMSEICLKYVKFTLDMISFKMQIFWDFWQSPQYVLKSPWIYEYQQNLTKVIGMFVDEIVMGLQYILNCFQCFTILIVAQFIEFIMKSLDKSRISPKVLTLLPFLTKIKWLSFLVSYPSQAMLWIIFIKMK